jgi:tight adherence protein B
VSAVLAASGGSSWMLVLGSVALFTALAIGFGMLMAPRVRRRRLADELNGATAPSARAQMSTLGTRATELAERGLAKHDSDHVVAAALERAGIDLSAGEFVLIATVSTMFGVLLGALFMGLLGLLVVGGCTAGAFALVVSTKAAKRQAAFADALPDALTLLSGSLRAGHSFPQAMDALTQELTGPISEEFRRALFEIQLGHSVGDALRSVARRVRSEDFDWVVQAIDIQREVGGDLAAVLDNVGATIRDRTRIARQIRSLTAEGRFSGLVLFALPIVVLLFLMIVNPGYMDALTDTLAGMLLLGFAGFLMLVGAIWLRRIVRLVY